MRPEDEHGDMDQIALDFCDWWVERVMRYSIEMIEVSKLLSYEYTCLAHIKADRLFGHDNFVPRR